MSGTSPFVVVVTGVTGQVGKSTVANNLGVYLKALREDLPVTLLSFDPGNDPSVMFRLAHEESGTVEDLFAVGFLESIACLGQFGVHYLAVSHDLSFVKEPGRLRHILGRDERGGVVIIDAGTEQNDLWRNAVWAADLVLAPVGDYGSLAHLSLLRRELLDGGGCEEMLWLLPSSIGDAMGADVKVCDRQLLRFAAEERECQVLDQGLSEDQRVHLQAVCKGRSVLTQLPGSYVHVELRSLAEFLLQKVDDGPIASSLIMRKLYDGVLPGRARRVDLICPLCGKAAIAGRVHYLESVPSRHRALLHVECLELLLEGTSLHGFLPLTGHFLVRVGIEGQGLRGEIRLILMNRAGDLIEQQQVLPGVGSGWDALLRAATGRGVNEQSPGMVAMSESAEAQELLAPARQRSFSRQRRKGFRKICSEEG